MDRMNPITEHDIANYLANTPGFFERHAELLSSVQLTSPHGNRAVSLQERQAEMLRDRIRALEQRVMEMVRHGNENVVIADRLQRWARSLFLVQDLAALPSRIADEIRTQFMVPQAAVKLWGLAPEFESATFGNGASEDVKVFANTLATPYCGVNSGFEAARWLPDPPSAVSLAMIALRAHAGPAAGPLAGPVFGMLVLASPDPQRFNGGMGTDFLERMGELAGAALTRLR